MYRKKRETVVLRERGSCGNQTTNWIETAPHDHHQAKVLTRTEDRPVGPPSSFLLSRGTLGNPAGDHSIIPRWSGVTRSHPMSFFQQALPYQKSLANLTFINHSLCFATRNAENLTRLLFFFATVGSTVSLTKPRARSSS